MHSANLKNKERKKKDGKVIRVMGSIFQLQMMTTMAILLYAQGLESGRFVIQQYSAHIYRNAVTRGFSREFHGGSFGSIQCT